MTLKKNIQINSPFFGSPVMDENSKKEINLLKEYFSNPNIQLPNHLENLVKEDKLNRYNLQNSYIEEVGIQCSGYMYLMFFLIHDVEKGKVFISPSLLPITNEYYKFNLVFPMGAYQLGDKIYVTAGEGDFYSLEMEFDKDEVEELCIYDTSNFDPYDYEYLILNEDGSLTERIQ